MSKELEALKDIKMSLARHLSKQTGYSVEKHFELLGYDTQIETIEKALTPPTEQEVCEALGEWLKEETPTLWNYKVYHDNGGFHYYNNEDYEVYLVDYDEIFERIFFPRYLPPHLITLIGRFYEGKVKE